MNPLMNSLHEQVLEYPFQYLSADILHPLKAADFQYQTDLKQIFNNNSLSSTTFSNL